MQSPVPLQSHGINLLLPCFLQTLIFPDLFVQAFKLAGKRVALRVDELRMHAGMRGWMCIERLQRRRELSHLRFGNTILFCVVSHIFRRAQTFPRLISSAK